MVRQSVYLPGLDNNASQYNTINPSQDLHGVRIDLIGAIETGEISGIGPEKLGSDEQCALMETH